MSFEDTMDATQSIEKKAQYGDDVRSFNSYEVKSLRRALKPRHLTFISIGACIGTGALILLGMTAYQY